MTDFACNTQYTPPLLLRNAHLQSIWPTLFRPKNNVNYTRILLPTPDNDELSVDTWLNGNNKVVILSHGLGGHTHRNYITGMAKILHDAGWDIVCWNGRWCCGTIQKTAKLTHSGATADLHTVVQYALLQGNYQQAALVGFSQGANISALYLGKENKLVPPQIKKAVLFSLPSDLGQTACKLAKISNKIYMIYLLAEIKKIMREIKKNLPETDIENIDKIKTFLEFDNRYTAPMHGFKDAQHYWQECSSANYMEKIKIPIWVVNAKNDPFLGPTAFSPSANPNVHLIISKHGGHCGWPTLKKTPYWHEKLARHLLCL